jgi:hypothetical protein
MISFRQFQSDDEINAVFENDDRFYEDFGFETVLHEEMVINKTGEKRQSKWGDVKGNTPEEQKASAIKIYQGAMKYVNAAKAAYGKILKTATRKIHDAKILVQVKKLEAFVTKVTTRGKVASKITDLLRGAVLVTQPEEVMPVVKAIKKEFRVVEYEIKSKGEDKKYGYHGAHHFLVLVDGVVTEIQVMTRKLWNYKTAAHQVYDKYRKGGDVDKKLKQLDINMSKNLFGKGNIRAKKVPNKR